MHFFVVYTIGNIAPVMASVAVVVERDVAAQEPSLKSNYLNRYPIISNGFITSLSLVQ